ncbi:hypothetical protein HPB50_000451 [Hyalomma asiaticum]|uniref:Uncharacterized protein n=1 Tax=Hyalomma asiaticum TaxID=266040 RepID=A0ACB7TET1_HYAAI|nr:hypothetical protein HPB50_000451 [Hyalomma asiaticum]
MESPYHCEDCKRKFNGPMPYAAHINGCKRPKNLHSSVLGISELKASPVICRICNVQLSSEVIYTLHELGKQHQSMLRLGAAKELLRGLDERGDAGCPSDVGSPSASGATPPNEDQPGPSHSRCETVQASYAGKETVEVIPRYARHDTRQGGAPFARREALHAGGQSFLLSKTSQVSKSTSGRTPKEEKTIKYGYGCEHCGIVGFRNETYRAHHMKTADHLARSRQANNDVRRKLRGTENLGVQYHQ